MYSGTTLTNISGNFLGVHQKVNRSAHKTLSNMSSVKHFPPSKLINYFEGKNGPDGIKRKSPAVDEPWHYYDPFDEDDSGLIDLIEDHYQKLVERLKERDLEGAAFEAAWLSHAIVDGLTPAHHHPYEQELEQIRGESKETRTSIKKKVLAKGGSTTDTIRKNWQLWGAKGLITTHGLFEAGVAMLLLPYWTIEHSVSQDVLIKAKQLGPVEVFVQSARKIGSRFAYNEFYRRGWTLKLSSWVRNDLAHAMVETVSVIWYLAMNEAGLAGNKKSKG